MTLSNQSNSDKINSYSSFSRKNFKIDNEMEVFFSKKQLHALNNLLHNQTKHDKMFMAHMVLNVITQA